MSLYTSGRDERNFKNAQKFSPDRWLRNDKGDYNGVINPHASLPFALGARSCVGRKIAETQLTLTIAEVSISHPDTFRNVISSTYSFFS